MEGGREDFIIYQSKGLPHRWLKEEELNIRHKGSHGLHVHTSETQMKPLDARLPPQERCLFPIQGAYMALREILMPKWRFPMSNVSVCVCVRDVKYNVHLTSRMKASRIDVNQWQLLLQSLWREPQPSLFHNIHLHSVSTNVHRYQHVHPHTQ